MVAWVSWLQCRAGMRLGYDNGNLQDQCVACHVVHGRFPGHGPCPLADDHSLNEAREEYELKSTKDEGAEWKGAVRVQRDEGVTSLLEVVERVHALGAVPGTEHWRQGH